MMKKNALYFSPRIIWVMKSEDRKGRTCNTHETKNEYKIFVEKPENNSHLEQLYIEGKITLIVICRAFLAI